MSWSPLSIPLKHSSMSPGTRLPCLTHRCVFASPTTEENLARNPGMNTHTKRATHKCLQQSQAFAQRYSHVLGVQLSYGLQVPCQAARQKSSAAEMRHGQQLCLVNSLTARKCRRKLRSDIRILPIAKYLLRGGCQAHLRIRNSNIMLIKPCFSRYCYSINCCFLPCFPPCVSFTGDPAAKGHTLHWKAAEAVYSCD